MDESKTEKKVVIPYKSLSKEALGGVIQDFILREGTDYGARELSYEEKQNRVIKQLDSGYISLVFDPTLESCTLIKSEELNNK